MRADLLDLSLRNAGIPIIGVSIGQPDDRTTWRVDFAAEATPEHRAAADALIATFDVGQAFLELADTPMRMFEDMAAAFQAVIIYYTSLRLERMPTPEEVDAEVQAIYGIYTQLRPLS